jgi:hypothetical protein
MGLLERGAGSLSWVFGITLILYRRWRAASRGSLAALTRACCLANSAALTQRLTLFVRQGINLSLPLGSTGLALFLVKLAQLLYARPSTLSLSLALLLFQRLCIFDILRIGGRLCSIEPQHNQYQA